MAQDKIQLALEVLLKDKNFKKKLKESENTMKKSASKQKGFIETIKKSWLGIAAAVGTAVILIKKAFDFAKEHAEYKQGMDALARNTGQNADTIVKKLAEVSKGTVANKDVMLAANRLVALNVTKDTDKMAQLFDVARVKAKAMGITTAQAVNDIATGIGRNSPLILDNLGIITKGWAEEAKAAGLAYDQQFILNKILEQGQVELARTGARVLTSAEKIQRLNASTENLKLSLGKLVSAGTKVVIESLTKLVNWTTKATNAITDFFDAVNKTKTEMQVSVNALKEYGVETKKQARAVEELANAYAKWKDAKLTMDTVLETQKKLTEQGKDSTYIFQKYGKIILEAGNTLKTTGKEMERLREILEETDITTGQQALEIWESKRMAIQKTTEEALKSAEINEEIAAAELEREEAKKEREASAREEKTEIEAILKEERFENDEEELQHKIDLIDKYLKYYQQGSEERIALQRAKAKIQIEIEKKKNAEIIKFEGEMHNAVKSGMSTVFDSYGSGIADMIVEGNKWKKNFMDFMSDMMKAVTKLIIKLLIVKALKSVFGFGFGGFFSEGGKVPDYYAGGGKVAYAAAGMKPQGTDTVPAMLTPGERVLSVKQTNAFDDLMKNMMIPSAGGISNVNNNTTNEGDSIVNNEFNNNFEGNTIDEMLELSQNTGTDLLRR